MAQPVYTPGSKFLLFWYPTTNSPGSAEYICGIESTGLSATASPIESTSRDCSGTTSKVEQQREPGVPSYEISGDGKYVAAHYEDLWETMDDRIKRRWILKRLVGDVGAETVGETWDGEFVLTKLDLGAPADGQNYATISISLSSSGSVVFTPAA